MDKAQAARYYAGEDLADPPPAYEDISRPTSSINSDFTDTTLAADSSPATGRPFPAAFNLYWHRKGSRSMKGIEAFQIGPHAEQPTNLIMMRAGWKGTSIALHQGVEESSTIIATASLEKTFSRSSVITLPTILDYGGEPVKELLKVHTHFTSMTYTFTVDTAPPGEKPQAENFEWRLSKGEEVRSLDKWAYGWKLVRMGGQSVDGIGGMRKERQVGQTSDGKELVAVWADNSKASKNKIGKFQFLGSGASGELGEKWSIMAVITAIRIFQNTTLGSTGGKEPTASASGSGT